jgi:hypothetical protein
MIVRSELTEFERLLNVLDGLTRSEITEIVTARIPERYARTFATLTAELSLEALRLVSARALLRQQAAAPGARSLACARARSGWHATRSVRPT